MAIAPGTLGFQSLVTSPSAPPAGFILLYTKTDNVVYIQDSSGTEIPLGTASGITSLTGDVTATGPGAAAAVVAFVGGKTAAEIAASVDKTDGATSVNFPLTLVERDASGNFAAGTITANLTGVASGNLALTGGTVTGPIVITNTSPAALIVDGNVFVVDASNNRIGINQLNPTEALDVVGNGKFSGTIVASNFSGSTSGTNTGDVTVTDTSTIDFTLAGQNIQAVVKFGDTTIDSNASGIKVASLSLTNSQIALAAAIAYSKLDLSNSIVNSDINSAAAIAYSKLNLSGSVTNSDISATANILRSKLNSGNANRLVVNDPTGVMVDASAITANRALISDTNGIPTQSVTTATELSYVNGVTSSIQDQLNAKTLPLPTNTEVVYVNKAGDDGTANGTLFKPYLTVAAAMTSITDASTNKRYVISMGAGTFIEPTLQLKPWIWIVGNGRSSTRINVTTAPNNVTLHPDWGIATSRGGFVNVYFTGSTGLDADFVALGGSTSAVFEIQDSYFNGNVIFKGRTTADFVEYLRGYVFGTTTLSSIQGFFFQITQIGPLVINTAGTANTTVQVLSCLVANTVTVNQTSTYNCTPQFLVSSIQNTVTAAKSGSGVLDISADVASLPQYSNVSLSGGATLSLLSDSKNLKYNATVPSDWAFSGSTPVDVQDALDKAATRLTNTLLKTGDTMSGNLNMGGNYINNLSNPVNPDDAANKDYVDLLAVGIIPQNPALDPDLIDDSLSTPPGSPVTSTTYLIGSSPTGAWASIGAGRLTYWDGTQWKDGLGRAIQIGDRLGVGFEHSGIFGGNFVGKKNYIATVTNATPGSYAYNFQAPTYRWTVNINNLYSDSNGETYYYNGTDWILFSTSFNPTAGVAISIVADVISVKYDTGTMGVNGSNEIYALNHGFKHLPAGSDPITTAAPSTNLDATTTNSVGTANSLARSDHSHDISTGVVSTQVPDQTNNEGSSSNLARADHTHNIPSGSVVQIGTSNFNGATASFALADHVHAHGNQTSGTLHAAATTSVNGFMSNVDKTKLDNATSVNTPSTLVIRDGSGDFSAGTITANLTGNASGSAASFTGNLAGDVTGPQGTTVVASVGGKSADQVSTSVDDTLAATSANTASTIVKRSAAGLTELSTQQLNGSTSGNIQLKAADTTTSYAVKMPAAQGVAGTYLTNDGSGNLTWSSPQINIDGGRSDSVFVIGANVVGGTP